MAIRGGDGSIILTTKVDQTGLNKGIKSMRSGVKSLSSSFKALGNTIATTFSVISIIRFSKQAGEFATQTEASVQRLIDIYGEASQTVDDFIDANARAIGLSKSAGASIASTYGNLLSVWADQKTNAELTNSLLNQTAVVASKTGRTTTDVAERIRSGLLGNTEAIEDLGINVNIKTIEITDAFKSIADGRSWEQLNAYEQAQVRTLAILEQSTKKYGTTVADTTATVRNQYQAAYEDFQNTWGQVVNTILIPVLKILTQVFTIATKGLQVMAGLSGKTIENSKLQENSIGNSVENQNDLTDAVKDTNKELKKSLAGFDEIDILSSGTADNADETSAADISNLGIENIVGNYNNSFVDQISGDLTLIMGIIGGALVAVGLILIFFGHVGWGVGFIIAGASIFAVSMAMVSSSGQVSPISEQLIAIMAIASIALLAIGLILLFNGAWKWGIGFIVAGALAFGIVAVATKSGNVTPEAEQMLLDIMLIAGSAMLALGIILMCLGVVNPLSIGLVVAGAGALVGAVALNSEAVGGKIKKFFQDNAGIIAGVSLALVVIGILLCFTPMLPLAIGLIAAGAVGLATTVALNWNAVKTKIVNVFDAVIDWVKTYGVLVLGILLCLTGAGVPLGIALIIEWVKQGAEKGVPLATVIVDKVKEIWAKIKAFWDSHIAPIFTAEWWKNLGKTVMNGLIAGFEAGINGIIGMFEKMINWIVNGLNSISFDVPDWVPGIGGKIFGFNIPTVNFGRVSIPRLAQGAVIPANREFLAVLGDQKQGVNIEAPLQTIVDAFNMALAQNGGYGGKTEVVLEVDGREFGRAVVEQGNRESKRIGTRLVIV